MIQEGIGIICISEEKNGTYGDSPEAQRESIIRRAEEEGYFIKEGLWPEGNWFEYWESRRNKDHQPVKEAIDICVKHKLPPFFRDIERFTRAGTGTYEELIKPLEKAGLKWFDADKVISHEKTNSLNKFGTDMPEYEWAVERKSKEKEKEVANDAEKDGKKTLVKLIGNEIRYSRLGYIMTGAPRYGYKYERQDCENGYRNAMIPRSDEAKYLKLIFTQSIEKVKKDQEIVGMVNDLGYKSRKKRRHHPDKNKKNIIIGHYGEEPLDVEQMHRYLDNPIYAGVMTGTRNGKKEPPRLFFGDPIVSIETWNKANEGKQKIYADKENRVYITRGKVPMPLLLSGTYNDDFPYKRDVLCPICGSPFYASYSRGKLGKKYPYYHCSKGHKLYSVPKDTFHKTIEKFVMGIELKPERLDNLKRTFYRGLRTTRDQTLDNSMIIDKRVGDLKVEQAMLIEKIDMYSNPLVIKAKEDKIAELGLELERLQSARNNQEKKQSNAQEAISTGWYFLEHIEELILQPDKPIQSVKLFGALFETPPTYKDLLVRTPKLAPALRLKDEDLNSNSLSVSDQGLEP